MFDAKSGKRICSRFAFLLYHLIVFFLALEEEFGSSRLGISLGLALMNLTMGLMAPFLGKAVDRYSIRTIV